jgi:hypothetical protein
MPSDTIELTAPADDDTLGNLIPVLESALSDARMARHLGQGLTGRELCIASGALRDLCSALNAALELEAKGFADALAELHSEVADAS